ncbi:MAG TPA: hypothetical protein VGF40_19480 [Thermoanaerobaculia bacterium]
MSPVANVIAEFSGVPGTLTVGALGRIGVDFAVIPDSGGGDTAWESVRPGVPEVLPVKLAGVSGSGASALHAWYLELLRGVNSRKNVTIKALARDSTPSIAVYLYDAIPLRLDWDPISRSVRSMTVMPARIEFASSPGNNGSASAVTAFATPDEGSATPYRLVINGVPTGIESVSGGTVEVKLSGTLGEPLGLARKFVAPLLAGGSRPEPVIVGWVQDSLTGSGYGPYRGSVDVQFLPPDGQPVALGSYVDVFLSRISLFTPGGTSLVDGRWEPVFDLTLQANEKTGY